MASECSGFCTVQVVSLACLMLVMIAILNLEVIYRRAELLVFFKTMSMCKMSLPQRIPLPFRSEVFPLFFIPVSFLNQVSSEDPLTTSRVDFCIPFFCLKLELVTQVWFRLCRGVLRWYGIRLNPHCLVLRCSKASNSSVCCPQKAPTNITQTRQIISLCPRMYIEAPEYAIMA